MHYEKKTKYKDSKGRKAAGPLRGLAVARGELPTLYFKPYNVSRRGSNGVHLQRSYNASQVRNPVRA
jgi:hypothetical protein